MPSSPPPDPPDPPPHFVQTGKASWYGDSRNADGTPVNNASDISAAHRSLPFGTRIKATRLDTGATVSDIVIHDRGPYVDGRIVDFRPKVAELLDMVDAGVVPIKIEAQ